MYAVLGIKAGPQHDTGACVAREAGTHLACTAIAEERLSRVKHDRAFPRRAIEYCLETQGLRRRDLTLVAIDLLSPTDLAGDINDARVLARLPEYDADLAAWLDGVDVPAVLVNHHLAHAASAYHVSGLPASAVLIVDGSGSAWPTSATPHRTIWMGPKQADPEYRLRLSDRCRETQTIFRGEGRRLERVAVSTRSGAGHFYTWVSHRVVGFGHLQEGKLMGLAGWGDPSFKVELPRIDDGWFDGIDTPILERLMDLGIAPPLRDGAPPTDAFYAAVARWAQDALERAMLHLAGAAVRLGASPHLCLAGGVALNVVANRLIRDRLDGTLFIQPAAGDTGTPLGCALHGYYGILGGDKPFQRELAFLGRAYDDDAIATTLGAAGARRSDDVYAETAAHLAADRIVGWWQGRSEYGPRALGRRSILCAPRSPGMKDHLNARVKHRESFRPFAPVVREERAPRFFDVDFAVPYMLINATVHPGRRADLPAITHVDGSARLQTVGPENDALYRLLAAYERVDDCGVLLNTSFNDAGEPIVETVEDAVRCFHRTGLDVLVCGDMILTRGDARGAAGVAAAGATVS